MATHGLASNMESRLGTSTTSSRCTLKAHVLRYVVSPSNELVLWHMHSGVFALKYVDALRLGNIQQFKEIEKESGDWWSPTMDRGAGACLHFAAEHGQVAFLLSLDHIGAVLSNLSG